MTDQPRRAEMRPRLREDVRFVETPDGAYVQGDLGACTLRGPRAYAWLSRLAPALTGEHALAELTGRLPDDKRELVEHLVHRLAEQRLVVDVRADEPHSLTEAELRTYDEEIAFVGYALDSPQRRFQRLRSSRMTMLGEGGVLRALLAAGLGCGWRHLRVVTSGRTEDLPEVIARARRDPAQTVRIEHGIGEPSELAAQADVILQVATETGPLVALCRSCRDSGPALGQILVRPDEAWLAPVGPPAETVAESGWRRLAALAGAEPATTEDWLTGPVPELLAGQLALGCFSYLTGLDQLPDSLRRPSGALLTKVDLRTLDTRPHRFVRHPRAGLATVAPSRADPAQPEAAARATASRLAAAPPVPAAELVERAAVLVDSRTGVLGLLDEGDLAQVPLAVCRATLSDPYRVLPEPVPPEVFGWGPERDTARSRTLLAALATYGTLVVDPGNGDPGLVWGTEVPSGQPRPVPAGDVYPALAGVRVPYQAPAGAAAGYTWAGAVAAGLRDHCAALLGERLAAVGHDFPQRDPATVPDPAVTHLTRLLATAGADVTVLDLTSVLDLPGYAFALDGRHVAVSCAPSALAALHDGLERTLLAWQARAERQPAYAAAAPRWIDAGGEAAVVRLAEALLAAGRRPVAVPLDRDAEATRQLPFLVRVVLRDD
jgi:hypothetical protein